MFMAIGVITPFWPVWLEHCGLAATEIGMVMAASQWSKVLLTPVVGAWVDHHRHRQRAAMVSLATASLIGFALLTPANDFWTLFMLTVPATACLAALMPLSETVALAEVRRNGADYGRMRLWGSLTFIGASVLTGAALEVWSVAIVVPAGILTAVAATVWAVAHVPDDRPPKDHSARFSKGRGTGRGFGRLLREPRFALFLGCAGLAQASHAPYYTFSTLFWRSAGLSETLIGILWAFGVVVEVGLFALGARVVARLGPVGLLASAGLGGVIRWTVLAFTTHPGALFAVQGLHALTFAAAHLGAMHFMVRAVPLGHAVRAQGLYSALALGAFFGLAMLASGWLYERVEGMAFLLATGLSLISLGLAIALSRRWDGAPLWSDDPGAGPSKSV